MLFFLDFIQQNFLLYKNSSNHYCFPFSVRTEAGPRRRGRLAEAAAAPSRMFIDGAIKMAFLGIIAHLLLDSDRYNMVFRAFLYGLALYGLLSALMDGPGAVVSQWLGVQVSPHFDKPWLSSGVVPFWNRR